MNIVTKDFPVTDLGVTDENPHGTFEVILSAPTLDRDGEIIDAKAFEPLPAHITFDTDHSMTCDSVVGSGEPYYAEDGTLRVKGAYAADERSQTIRRKVADGHIRTTSVTFMAAKREEKDGVPHVVKAELLNGTFTPVPSNRESVVLTAKSIIAKEGRRNSATDSEAIQTAHDLMAGLGASCEVKSASATGTKSLAGSVEALQDRVRDALSDADPLFAYLRGVVQADGGGTAYFVVYTDDDPKVYATEIYSQDFTDDGSVVTLTGDRTAVDIVENAVPDPDPEPKSADDSAEPAADAAGSADKSADEALAKAIENAALLRFGG